MRAEAGAAVVEFALVVPLVIVVLFAVVEVAVVARTQLEVTSAAREGAREAATALDPQRAVGVVRAALGPKGAGAIVAVKRPHVVGKRAEVTVRLRHQLAAALFGGLAVDITARAVMRVER